MRSNRSLIGVAGGCCLVLVLGVLAVPALFVFSNSAAQARNAAPPSTEAAGTLVAVVAVAPTFTVAAPEATEAGAEATGVAPGDVVAEPELVELYRQVNPGVVNISVFVDQQGGAGQGAGSGFILDDQGHIVTNNHVVAEASSVTVVFFDGTEVLAEVVGTDPDSDLAVLRVAEMPAGAHSLPLGDSDLVSIGEWVAAIGNPFGLGTSMSVGIVSATGRIIPSGATQFSIPEAIQTDAAINPGNSGGPLLNLQGEVVGVNAQIRTNGANANSGVGFAIPANVVRRVAPALIANGSYEWPWLGISGESVNLLVAEANDLPTQHGAYIFSVEPGGPADLAGIRGADGAATVSGIEVPVGGDVVIGADGQPVDTFTDLLAITSQHQPGEEMTLTVLRGGQEQAVTLTLQPRP